MASSLKTTPIKGKEGKRERSESRGRPWKPRELVPTEPNELALLLRVQQKGGWGLECIAPEAFNGQVIHQKVKQITGIEPLSVDLVNDVDVILELPNDALVTRVGQELQKVVEWGGVRCRCQFTNGKTISHCRCHRYMDRDGGEILMPERGGHMTP